MAGDGTRIAELFDGLKPLMPILEMPMFYWAAKNIDSDVKIFIVRKEHVEQYNIDSIIKKFFPDAIILIQNTKLGGQLLSVLVAFEYINTDDDIVIADCDMYSELDFNLLKDTDHSSLLVFDSSLNNYSYISEENNNVIAIAEKMVISNHAIGGIFYWKSGKQFLKFAIDAIVNNIKTNNEYYVSSVYNRAIAFNKKIKTVVSERTFDLSTKNGIDLFITHINKNHEIH